MRIENGYRLQSAVGGRRSAVGGQRSAVSGRRSAVSGRKALRSFICSRFRLIHLGLLIKKALFQNDFHSKFEFSSSNFQ
jgi:hypothetical protein